MINFPARFVLQTITLVGRGLVHTQHKSPFKGGEETTTVTKSVKQKMDSGETTERTTTNERMNVEEVMEKRERTTERNETQKGKKESRIKQRWRSITVVRLS